MVPSLHSSGPAASAADSKRKGSADSKAQVSYPFYPYHSIKACELPGHLRGRLAAEGINSLPGNLTALINRFRQDELANLGDVHEITVTTKGKKIKKQIILSLEDWIRGLTNVMDKSFINTSQGGVTVAGDKGKIVKAIKDHLKWLLTERTKQCLTVNAATAAHTVYQKEQEKLQQAVDKCAELEDQLKALREKTAENAEAAQEVEELRKSKKELTAQLRIETREKEKLEEQNKELTAELVESKEYNKKNVENLDKAKHREKELRSQLSEMQSKIKLLSNILPSATLPSEYAPSMAPSAAPTMSAARGRQSPIERLKVNRKECFWLLPNAMLLIVDILRWVSRGVDSGIFYYPVREDLVERYREGYASATDSKSSRSSSKLDEARKPKFPIFGSVGDQKFLLVSLNRILEVEKITLPNFDRVDKETCNEIAAMAAYQVLIPHRLSESEYYTQLCLQHELTPLSQEVMQFLISLMNLEVFKVDDFVWKSRPPSNTEQVQSIPTAKEALAMFYKANMLRHIFGPEQYAGQFKKYKEQQNIPRPEKIYVKTHAEKIKTRYAQLYQAQKAAGQVKVSKHTLLRGSEGGNKNNTEQSPANPTFNS